VNFVVDTSVLYTASEGKHEAINFLRNVYLKCHRVYVDSNGKILTEYRSVHGVFISQWLKLVSTRRIQKVKIKKRCENILCCKRDMVFVYVCLNCRWVKIIVSEDHHFTKNSGKLLRRGIRLFCLNDALEASKQQN